MYIFDWTVPHCVLTLKLIAVAFDLLDGTVTKPRQKVKNSSEGKEGKSKSKGKDESETGSKSESKNESNTGLNQDRIEDVPTLLQLLSHSYFPASFLVGPQFSIKHTIAFVEHDLENENILISVWIHAVGRIVGSLYYLIILLIGSHLFPPEYLLSLEFNTLPLIWRLIYFTITVRIQFYRYFFFFLFSEGNCILYGVNFDRNKDAICFKLCSNVDPIAFDFTGISFLTSFNQGYNTSTNRWIGKYVFHRLPFIRLSATSSSGCKVRLFENCVNHKFTRVFISSMFVCLWHGFHPGYLFTFSYIPINYIIEWDFLHHYWPSIQLTFNVRSFQEFKPFIKIPLYILLRIYCMFSLSNAYVSLLFLSFDRFIAIFKSILFIQHFLFLLYIIIRISLITIK